MRLLSGVVVLCAAAPALAQPTPAASMEPPPPPPAAPLPTTYYQPPVSPYLPAPVPTRAKSWFGVVGLGGMGYLAREDGFANDSDKGSGVALELVAGRWIRDDFAIGGRLEAHTDDAELYTHSSFTVVARVPLAAGGRLYLEPGFGIGFFKSEPTQETESGLAVAMTGGYALAKRRFAFDLRFGIAHYRIGDEGNGSNDHGTVWFGGALGFQ
jgi:hypothetical protein